MLCDEGMNKSVETQSIKIVYKIKIYVDFSELKYCEENHKTCLNGGKCTSLTKDEGLFECECPTGFKGKRCEIVPIIANSTISSTSKPLTTSTKLPNQDTSKPTEEDADEQDAGEQTTEGSSHESDVVEEPSVEEIDNEA